MKNTWMDDYTRNVGYYSNERTSKDPTALLQEPTPWEEEQPPSTTLAVWWGVTIGIAATTVVFMILIIWWRLG
jgi:hypothetical protein